MIKATLKVDKIDKDDVFGDVVRVHYSHRPGIRSGKICRMTILDKKILLVARNVSGNNVGIVRLDDASRYKLGVKIGQEYECSFEEVGFIGEFMWGWSASSPVNRVAVRLGLLSVILGLIGLLLGGLSLFK